MSDILPVIEASDASIEDKLCTAVEHEAEQIRNVLKNNLTEKGEILITGGGAFNKFMIERIKFYAPANLKVIIPDTDTTEYKEAIIFAFMGVLRERGEANCLKSVTGASIDVSGGEVFLPY